MQYFDKNGVEIKAGMTIRMEDGSLELVYDTTDSYGNPDLGINASNEATDIARELRRGFSRLEMLTQKNAETDGAST